MSWYKDPKTQEVKKALEETREGFRVGLENEDLTKGVADAAVSQGVIRGLTLSIQLMTEVKDAT